MIQPHDSRGAARRWDPFMAAVIASFLCRRSFSETWRFNILDDQGLVLRYEHLFERLQLPA